MKYETGHPGRSIRQVNIALLILYPFAFTLCTHFVNDTGIFGSLFFLPLVLAGWNWGLKRALALAVFGGVFNDIFMTVDAALLKNRPFTIPEAVLGGLPGLALYLVVGFIVGRISDATRALSKALNEVKVLTGLIPICAKCKQIRDDQGYWRQIEEYIRERSDAEFSHGLCPKCANELYGDVVAPQTPGKAVREDETRRMARVMEYQEGHPSLLVRRISIVLLAVYPVAFALCTHFVTVKIEAGIFGSLFVVPLAFAAWNWGLKRALGLAVSGTTLNLIIIVFDLGVLQHQAIGPLDAVFGFSFGLALYLTVGSVVGRISDANRALNKALNEVKVLRGFIPICAKCKQIRDDQGYWRQIEEYLREHSEAVFSHGLCPKCARELYGDAAAPPEKAGGAVR